MLDGTDMRQLFCGDIKGHEVHDHRYGNEYVRCCGILDGEIDQINHPVHYTSHPSGIECIEITRWMGFNLGNAVKYIWRADLKDDAIEDLEKAVWYVQDEIAKRKAAS